MIEPSPVALLASPTAREFWPFAVVPAPMAVALAPAAWAPQPRAVLPAVAAVGLVQLAGLLKTPLPMATCANAACGIMTPAIANIAPTAPPTPSDPSPILSRFMPSVRCACRSTASSRRRSEVLPASPDAIQLRTKPLRP
ncbi:hypothetical protein FBF72_21455 [Bradyrhizobium elkanii]|nr:hypothetical protein [Bradyrhizobium elkanii]